MPKDGHGRCSVPWTTATEHGCETFSQHTEEDHWAPDRSPPRRRLYPFRATVLGYQRPPTKKTP